MEEGKPSQTALMVAMLRARHFLHEPEPKILRDSLAGLLGGASQPEQVSSYLDQIKAAFTAMSDADTASRFVSQLEHSVCIRARLVEEELAEAKTRGATQFVVLGAGLDSTAYREQGLLSGMGVFEVDHPDSQKWKRDCLENGGVDIPKNVTFVPFDFENTTLKAALSEGGVDSSKITVFSWLGVQMYLTDEAVKGTLGVMAGFALGSSLVMDFVSPSYETATNEQKSSVDDLRKIVAGMREPFLSEYSVADLSDRFEAAGFSRSHFPMIGEFADQYLNGNLDRLEMHPKAQYLAVAYV